MVLFSEFPAEELREHEFENNPVVKLISEDGINEISASLLVRHSLLLSQILFSDTRNDMADDEKYTIRLPYIKNDIVKFILEYMKNSKANIPAGFLFEVIKACYLLQVNFYHFSLIVSVKIYLNCYRKTLKKNKILTACIFCFSCEGCMKVT